MLVCQRCAAQYPDEAEMCGPCGYRFSGDDHIPTLHIVRVAPYTLAPPFRAARARLESAHDMPEPTCTRAPERGLVSTNDSLRALASTRRSRTAQVGVARELAR